MQHFGWLRQWLWAVACISMWPAIASAADPPVMTARLHVVKGFLELEPGSVQFRLGQWAVDYDAQCGITEADLRGRMITHANATLKARGNVLEQFAIGKSAAYMLCAAGIPESKAGRALIGKAGRLTTTRNLATVLKLRALAINGTPNPSIERTSSGKLRLPAAAAHVKR